MYNADHAYLESVDDDAPLTEQLTLSGILRGPRENIVASSGRHEDCMRVVMG